MTPWTFAGAKWWPAPKPAPWWLITFELSSAQAVIWYPDDTMVSIAPYPFGATSIASDISADGSVVVGVRLWPTPYEAFRWTEASGMTGIGFLSERTLGSEDRAVSNDARVIVGSSYVAPNARHAFLWTQELGMLDLGYLPGGGERADALGVSDGGTVVVGMSEISPSSGDYAAFIWDAANGMRNLRSVLEADYASCVEGWTLEMASAVSADGRTIAGVGDHPDGTRESWLVRIGPPPPYCPGDTNGDGIVDNADLQAVLDAWGATVGSPAFRCNADLANDGVIGNADLPVLLDNWATDCN